MCFGSITQTVAICNAKFISRMLVSTSKLRFVLAGSSTTTNHPIREIIIKESPIVNTAPVADDQTVITDVNTAVNITLTATDAQSDPLTYTVIAQPQHGTLSGTSPNLVYTPDAGYTGTDSFTFRGYDGLEHSNIATVSIDVQ
jgi:hypothetical protein